MKEFNELGGESQADFTSNQKMARAEVISEELKPYIPQVQDFIDRHRAVLNTIARDSSLSFQPGKGFSIDYEAGVISLDVEFWKMAQENKLNERQIYWAVLHEISHFFDLLADAEGLLQGFGYNKGKAKEFSQIALNIWQSKGVQVPDYLLAQMSIGRSGERMSALEIYFYKIFNQFYNCLDDIYVNNVVANQIRAFSSIGSWKDETADLYARILFPPDLSKRAFTMQSYDEESQEPNFYPEELGDNADEEFQPRADYSFLPLHKQFAYYLLRKRMVPNQEIIVSSQVRQALDQKEKYTGRTLEQEAMAINKYLRGTPNKAQDRYTKIRYLIEPAFYDLLRLDIETMDLPEPPQKGQGEGGDGLPGGGGQGEGEIPTPKNEGSQEEDEQDSTGDGETDKDQKESESSSKEGDRQSKDSQSKGTDLPDDSILPNPFSEEEIRDFIKQRDEKRAKEAEKKEQEESHNRLTPEERAKEAIVKSDEEFCKRHGIDPIVAKEYRFFQQEVSPYVDELAQVFAEIMKAISHRLYQIWEQGFRSGRFDVNHFVRHYAPYLIEGAPPLNFDKIDSYEQRAIIEKLSLFPDRIRLRLVLDASGSMFFDVEGKKITDKIFALKEIMVLILTALEQFEFSINHKFKLKNPIVVDTEFRIFGDADKTYIIKPFSKTESSAQNERYNRLLAFSKIKSCGETCDAQPFWEIAASLQDPQYLKDLEEGKAREFVFEITDGGSNQVSSVARPDTSPAQDTRNAIEAVNRQNVSTRGIQVGTPSEDEEQIFDQIWGEDGKHIERPQDLASFIAKTLADEMAKIRYKIFMEEGEEDEENL